MPQLRQDPTTKEWIIIAAERSKRPHDFKKTKTLVEKPPCKEDCPFCQGNEHLTPHESLANRSGGLADSKGWWVRVIPNKFPALSPPRTISLLSSSARRRFQWITM
jgi:UDPglucose--hexose-1-phosphate uridylyltransferase